MADARDIFDNACRHLHEPYVLGASVPKNDANWKGPWDCAEFVSWLVYQEAGFLFGCTDDHANPAVADAYTGAWQRDSDTKGRRVGVETAAGIKGAVLLRYPPGTKKGTGHIVLADGQGGTVEAHSHIDGVIRGKVDDRWWDTGILVPGITYDESAPSYPWHPPATIYRLGGSAMNGAYVRQIQAVLAARSFYQGQDTGSFDQATADAVAAFQAANGLVPDGAVGPQTANALGLNW